MGFVFTYFIAILLLTPNHAHAAQQATERTRLFVYQGDYNQLMINKGLAPTVDNLANYIATNYDHVILTNAFNVIPKGGSTVLPDVHLRLTNGKCQSTAYHDRTGPKMAGMGDVIYHPNGKGIKDLVKKIRTLRTNTIKIYGYVPATADNQKSCWGLNYHEKNFKCPNGLCSDFIKWVSLWQGIEDTGTVAANGVYMDGFFLDMANEDAIHKYTWANETAYIHSLKSPRFGNRNRSTGANGYKVMANTLAIDTKYIYSSGNSSSQLYPVYNTIVPVSKPPLEFVGEYLLAGDSYMFEGFNLKAGLVESQTALAEAFHQARALSKRGIGFHAIASEIGYSKPEDTNWYKLYLNYVLGIYTNMGYTDPTVQGQMFYNNYFLKIVNNQYVVRPEYERCADVYNYAAATGQYWSSNGDITAQARSSCLNSARQTACSHYNGLNAYSLFRNERGVGANKGGGISFTYQEANIGSQSHRWSDCDLTLAQ